MTEAMKYLEKEPPLKCFQKCLFGLAMTLLLSYINFYFYIVESVDLFLKALLHKCSPNFFLIVLVFNFLI